MSKQHGLCVEIIKALQRAGNLYLFQTYMNYFLSMLFRVPYKLALCLHFMEVNE